jgi:hypothetical protein
LNPAFLNVELRSPFRSSANSSWYTVLGIMSSIFGEIVFHFCEMMKRYQLRYKSNEKHCGGIDNAVSHLRPPPFRSGRSLGFLQFHIAMMTVKRLSDGSTPAVPC